LQAWLSLISITFSFKSLFGEKLGIFVFSESFHFNKNPKIEGKNKQWFKPIQSYQSEFLNNNSFMW
jgi:hypothetical protein